MKPFVLSLCLKSHYNVADRLLTTPYPLDTNPFRDAFCPQDSQA